MKRLFSRVIPRGTAGCILIDTLEGWVQIKDEWVLSCYLAVENLPDNSVHLHIYVNEEGKNPRCFRAMQDNFIPVFTEYMQEIKKSKLLVSCPDDLPKVKRLIESFGFELTPIWFGSVDFNS